MLDIEVLNKFGIPTKSRTSFFKRTELQKKAEYMIKDESDSKDKL